MLSGGMITSKPLFYFLFIPVLVILVIVFIANFELFYNLIVYGKIAGPCVWPSDYENRGYGSRENLIYDENLQCYLLP